jgi:hypothetical protein
MQFYFEGDRVLLQSLTRAKWNKYVGIYFVILLGLLLLTSFSSPSTFGTILGEIFTGWAFPEFLQKNMAPISYCITFLPTLKDTSTAQPSNLEFRFQPHVKNESVVKASPLHVNSVSLYVII